MVPPRISTLAALAVATGCTFEVTEKAFLFPREKPAPTELLTPCQRINVEVPVADAVALRGWALTSPANDRWVLWFYGNSQRVMSTEEQQDALARIFHANVVAVDYRGYGFSDGTPTLTDIARDGLTVFDYVDQKLAKGKPIVVAAHSLGTIPAMFVASQRPVAGAVLMGTVTSAQDALDMLVRTIPWWQRVWVNVKLAPALRDLRPTASELLSTTRSPLLFIHGTNDELFPIDHARRLLEGAASSSKQFCAIDGGTHQNAVPSSRSTHRCLEAFAESLAASPR